MSTESELQAQYDAAVKDWKSAKQASEAAEKERDEKEKLVNQQPKDSREYYLAWAEYWKGNMTFVEKCEQEYSVECEKCELAVYLMVHRHGVKSKATQIAKHRLELTRTKSVNVDGIQYLTKWEKLRSKGWQVYYQLEAAGCHPAAAELWKPKDEFYNRINNESNGKAFHNAWNAANAALDKWENEDDRTNWDAAKPKYDAALEKWNAFKPKGDAYAKTFERKISESINNTMPIAFILNEHVQAQIQRLEDHLEQKIQDINDLKKQLEQQCQEICKLVIRDAEKDKEFCELKNDDVQNNKEICKLVINDAEEEKDICDLKNNEAEKDKEICELKKNLEEQSKEKCELKNDLEQKSMRIRKLEDGGEKKCQEMCELKETIAEMAECIKSLTQGFQTMMRGQCQYIAESEATARTAVEREWQLWCEYTMAERRTLQESEAVASHHQHEEEFYNFDD